MNLLLTSFAPLCPEHPFECLTTVKCRALYTTRLYPSPTCEATVDATKISLGTRKYWGFILTLWFIRITSPRQYANYKYTFLHPSMWSLLFRQLLYCSPSRPLQRFVCRFSYGQSCWVSRFAHVHNSVIKRSTYAKIIVHIHLIMGVLRPP
jgi:hypothetical protein